MIDLKSILKTYPDCLSSRASFRAILLDMYPNERRTINIMLSMYESGIVRKIQSKNALLSADVESILSFIENEYGISVKYATEAVYIWAAAYDIPLHEAAPSKPVVIPNSNLGNPEESTYARQTRTRSHRSYVDLSNDASVHPCPNSSRSVNTDPLEWETSVLPSGNLMISRFVGVDNDEVIVPNSINGISVTAIGSEAFDKCIGIKSIIVSEGIVEIQDGAFFGCTALEKVILPNSLVRLGSNGLNVSKGVFEKTGLKQIVLPDGLTYIAPKAFKWCQQLRTMQLPNSVVEICDESFFGCIALREVYLPNGLTSIGENAFSKTNLEEIYIPDGVQEIRNYTFYKCTRLKNVSLPDSIEKIADYAFSWSGLLSIYIPDKVLSLGRYSFYQCPHLKDVSLPQNLKEIGEYAFSRTAIVNIKIPGTVDTINQNAFSDCSQLSSVAIFEGVRVIDDFSFDNCAMLKEIIIPMSVCKIGINAFMLLVQQTNWHSKKPDREKNKNLVIACYPGSYGLEYARKNSYKTKTAVYPK